MPTPIPPGASPWSIGLPLGLALWSAPVAGQEPSPECVQLAGDWEQGARLDDFDSVLEAELDNRGVALHSSPGSGNQGTCRRVTVEALATDVVVVEVEGQRARVVELSTLEPELRARSLALVVAEEIHALRADLPALRNPPQPQVPDTAVPPPPETPGAIEPSHSHPAGTAGREVSRHTLLVGALVLHAVEPGQLFGGGSLGGEIDVGAKSLGALRAGVEAAFGTQATAFGDIDAFWIAPWVGWRWTPWQSKSEGAGSLALHLIPSLGLGVAFSSAEAAPGILSNRETATKVFFHASLAAAVGFKPTEQLAFELGPTIRLIPDPPVVRGDGGTVAGLGTFSWGGVFNLKWTP